MKTKIEREQYEKLVDEILNSSDGKDMKRMYSQIGWMAVEEEDEEDRLAAYIAIVAGKKIMDETYNKVKDHFEIVEEIES